MEKNMKVREIMTREPICCLPSDSAQDVATLLRDHNIGSAPVVLDHDSGKLIGIITDRDLCCTIMASGLEPKATPIKRFVTVTPLTCREEDDVEACLALMRLFQIRRVPIVDAEGCCIGIVSQADLVRHKPEHLMSILPEISKTRPEPARLSA
jgi:CBS domain-containing protein